MTSLPDPEWVMFSVQRRKLTLVHPLGLFRFYQGMHALCVFTYVYICVCMYLHGYYTCIA